ALDPSLSVFISLRRLSTAIHEILQNAFNFSQCGQRVLVSLGASKSQITISVADSGVGMSAEQISELEAFRQFEPSRYTQQGLGLGLAVAQKLLDKDGGALRIESAVGTGTTARASWPRQSAPDRFASADKVPARKERKCLT